MVVTAPSNANKLRPNPKGLQTGSSGSSILPDVYTGSMDEMAPTTEALRKKADDIISLLKYKDVKDSNGSKKMDIIKEAFRDFYTEVIKM